MPPDAPVISAELTVVPNGENITSVDGKINCGLGGTTCAAQYDLGSTVELHLNGGGGDCDWDTRRQEKAQPQLASLKTPTGTSEQERGPSAPPAPEVEHPVEHRVEASGNYRGAGRN